MGRIDYGRGDPHELHLMGLWDGLGEQLGDGGGVAGVWGTGSFLGLPER